MNCGGGGTPSADVVAEATPKAQAVLQEILQALTVLAANGQSNTLFIDKMALSAGERCYIKEVLGEGSIRINYGSVSEPVEWLESAIAGIWYGAFFNQKGQPVLETVEIAVFPGLAAAQQEDMEKDIILLQAQLTDQK